MLDDLKRAISLLPPKQPETVILTSERDYRKVKLIARQQQALNPVTVYHQCFFCDIRIEAHKDMVTMAKRARKLKRDNIKVVIFSSGQLMELKTEDTFQNKQQEVWNRACSLSRSNNLFVRIAVFALKDELECLREMNQC